MVAQAAALVHDLGHGPFSHAFEDALEKLGIKKRHEEWTAEIAIGDTMVAHELGELAEDVGSLLASDSPVDIYSSIVSSQFDADRLDYFRRDRLMTGVQHGGVDFSWILANLEVETVTAAIDGEEYGNVECLVLGNKAFEAAEEYVLGLFHLYFTVYFHKATRSAEKMIGAVLERLGRLTLDDAVDQTGLDGGSPLIQFIKDQSLGSYLALDDSVLWASLQRAAGAQDPSLAELSKRILNRKLYKAIDVAAQLQHHGGEAAIAKFRLRLKEEKKKMDPIDILEDQATRNPYKRRGLDSADALSKVFIRRTDGTGYVDLFERSRVVSTLQEQSIFRVYVRNEEIGKAIYSILKESQQ